MMYERLLQIFGILTLRYFVIAGSFFVLFYVLLKSRLSFRKIQREFPQKADYFREIGYSLLSTVIFTLTAVLVLHPAFLRPYTRIYSTVDQYGFWYLGLSFILMVIIHDTYFYWTHRAMHSKAGMKYFHRVHHRSTNPSPWAAFSFHPLEGIVEAGVLMVFAFLFPVHVYSIIIFMVFMTIYNVYGHLGWELYPKGFARSKAGRFINTSVNHNLHHKKFEGNYGLYFLFWDRMMGTLRVDYDDSFDEVTSRKKNQSEKVA